MAAAGRALRERLGDEAASELRDVVDQAGHKWKDDVTGLTAERFERRLAQETGAIRLDLARECAALRGEMARELAAVRVDMATGFALTRADLVKWSFLFWIGQFAAITGMMALLLRTIR